MSIVHITNNVHEFGRIGYDYVDDSARQAALDKFLKNVAKPVIIIASLTTHQEQCADFLKRNKFKIFGGEVINPNTNNSILLFYRKVCAPRVVNKKKK